MWRCTVACCSTVFVAWLAGQHSAAAQSPAPAGVRHAQLPPDEAAQQLVVMVDARFGPEESLGAGVIFDKQPDALYIVTANHVVRRGATEAGDIRVRLKTLPGEALVARLLLPVNGPDLAVLKLEGTSRFERALSSLRLDCLGDVNVVKARDQVYAIGQPNGQRWDVGTGADVVTRVDGTTFAFRSLGVAPGSSGGGLFDARRQLIGLVQRDAPPSAEALRIDVVARTLEAERYTVSWQRASGKGTPPVDPPPTTYPPPDPKIPPVFTGPMGPLEPGVSYSGGDIYDRPSSSAQQCVQLCANDNRCRAVTFIISQQRCWVKGSINAPQPSSDMVSSRKQS